MNPTKLHFLPALLFILLINWSCKKSVYNQLTEDEMQWLTYKVGDRMIFSVSGTVRDTFDIVSRDRGYIKDKPYYNEAASTNFVKLNDTLGGNKLGLVHLAKDNDNRFSVSIAFPHFHKRADITDMTPLPFDTINGIPFPDVYIVQADTFLTSVNDFIWKVYYSKVAGFVKLEDIYGRTWYKTN